MTDKTKTKIKSSGYAALDITRGRNGVAKRLMKGEKVIFDVRLELDPDWRAWSDDTVSIQFGCKVLEMDEVK
ncbi:hypothetical protein [Kiloniella antarctica]|uniref:Uncharacterized protein n=1 Tax=Kiloniella antarctica TaxID=1550907 RepID=A0ABW5BR05_9PROT